MLRPLLPAALSAAALFGTTLGGCRPAPPPVPRHVLLVVIDTLRADALGAFGHAGDSSPALDDLAARGVIFTRAISQCSWTAPSMVSLMTGRWVAGDRLDVPLAQAGADQRLPTIATSFAAAGWRTAAFVYNDIVSVENGYGGGFEHFSQHVPYEPNDPIVDWLSQHAAERTFTYVHLNEPHDPYEPPPEWQRRLADPPPVSPERRAYFQRAAGELGLPPIDEDVARIEHGLAGYDDDVHFADHRVGGLLAALDALGIRDQTAIVVTADHGEGLWTRPAYASGDRAAAARRGEPPTLFNTLKMTHGNQLYPELVNVPLILSAPGLPAGKRCTQVVENVDVWPTLLELCDLPAPAGLDGSSLLELASGRGDWRDRKPAAFSATRFAVSVIDQDGWQLLLPTALGECLEGLEPELYDLNADWEARSNLAASRPQVVERLVALAAQRAQRGLPGAIPDAALERNLDTLRKLGYVGGIISTGAEERRDDPTPTLLEVLASRSDQDCLQRLYAAQALVQRRAELSPDERARALELAQGERSRAVRAELAKLAD